MRIYDFIKLMWWSKVIACVKHSPLQNYSLQNSSEAERVNNKNKMPINVLNQINGKKMLQEKLISIIIVWNLPVCLSIYTINRLPIAMLERISLTLSVKYKYYN